jgi:hypothetical protein
MTDLHSGYYWFRRDRKGEASRCGVYTDRGTAAYWAGKRGGYVRSRADELAADELALIEESEASYTAFVAEQLLAAE